MCYHAFMNKNITLSIDEKILRQARRVALERDTSVNALVRDYLEKLVEDKKEDEKLRLEALASLKQMSRNSGSKLGADYKFDREEIYER